MATGADVRRLVAYSTGRAYLAVYAQKLVIEVDERARDTFASQALDLANLACRGGATTNIEVIDAERQARDAETQAEIAADTSRQARLTMLTASNRFPEPT